MTITLFAHNGEFNLKFILHQHLGDIPPRQNGYSSEYRFIYAKADLTSARIDELEREKQVVCSHIGSLSLSKIKKRNPRKKLIISSMIKETMKQRKKKKRAPIDRKKKPIKFNERHERSRIVRNLG